MPDRLTQDTRLLRLTTPSWISPRLPSSEMMNSPDFAMQRRQAFLTEESFRGPLQWFDNDYQFLEEKLREAQHPRERASALSSKAFRYWNTFQLRLTAGDSLDELAAYLTQVVAARSMPRR